MNISNQDFYHTDKKTILNIVLISLFFFIPIFFSNSSLKGVLIVNSFFIIIGISDYFKRLALTFIPKIAIFSILIFQLISVSAGIFDLIKIFPSLSIQRIDVITSSFKTIPFLGYDANYVACLILLFLVHKFRISYFILLIFSGSRAAYLAYFLIVIFRLFKVKIYRNTLTYIFIFLGLLLTINYFSSDLLYLSKFGSGIYFKALTINDLLEIIKSYDFKSLLFGLNENNFGGAYGLSYSSDLTDINGHTLAGVSAEAGIFYTIYSIMIFACAVNIKNDKGCEIFFCFFLISCISFTAFLFLTPLAYCIYNHKFKKNIDLKSSKINNFFT